MTISKYTMKAFTWFGLLGLIGPVTADIWPAPSFTQLDHDHEALWLSEDFKIQISCSDEEAVLYQNPLAAGFRMAFDDWMGLPISRSNNTSELTEVEILHDAVIRTAKAIKQTSFVPWKFHSRQLSFEPIKDGNSNYLEHLRIEQRYAPEVTPFDPRFFYRDESYEISVSKRDAKINSNSTIGTLRALETFRQLFYSHTLGSTYIPKAPLVIRDAPKWRHRGLSLDIARNVFAPEDVIRTIEAMASTKLSRLHIHATDSQSWPIDIPALPELAPKGAYQPHLIWSPEDLKRVQVHGAKRGVEVFLEIDMPGHTASVAYAFPHLVVAFNEPDWSTFAAEPQSGQLKLDSSDVYDFVDTLLQDLLPRTGEYSATFHAGGDEVNMNVHLLDETVLSNDPTIIQPLLQYFVDRVLDHCLGAGMRPILWEEMVLDWNLTLPKAETTSYNPGVLIQVWRDSKNLIRVLEKGHRVLFGDHGYWYLDCGFGGFTNPYPAGSSPPGVPYNTSGGIASRSKKPYLDYCNPMSNWRYIYTYDPLVNISSNLHHLIEGGEVLLWSEQTDAVDLDSKLWPRAAAAAEVLWSGPRSPEMIDDASKRLGEWRERVVIDHSVRSGPVQMTWCLMEGGCVY